MQADVNRAAFDRLLICGVGLIGASLARALRRASPAGIIVGVDRDGRAAARAVELGVVECGLALEDIPAVIREAALADMIVLAAPVAQTGPLIERLRPHLRPTAVLTDVGSVKGSVVAAARHGLGERIDRFVPAHPIAGAERSGVEASTAGLFDGRRLIVCPLPETAADALARVEAMWRSAGAQVETMTIAEHDRVFAAVSHLPHLVAFAFVEAMLRSGEARRRLEHAGTGFRDFTRIAGSSPEMWRDICMENRLALLEETDRLGEVLGELRDALVQGDAETLRAVFERASHARLSGVIGE